MHKILKEEGHYYHFALIFVKSSINVKIFEVSFWYISFSSEKSKGFLEKWSILALKEKTYKISQEHLVVPESKKVLKPMHTFVQTHTK